jgi:hypothetical protein
MGIKNQNKHKIKQKTKQGSPYHLGNKNSISAIKPTIMG